ncbi:MAG: hypothetical protein LCH93_06730 [Proteobacteria bacterium]|nr:hypothetical protein [Pseudomonadota bacterium]
MIRLVATLASTAILLLAGAAAVAQTYNPTRWIEYKPNGGRYRVEMPAIPKTGTVSVPTGAGTTVPMMEATTVVDGVAYVASYVDYPASVTRNAAADAILTQVRNGAAAGNSWRDEKKLQLGRSEGRQFTVVQAGGNVSVARIYWVRGRLYQLVVEGPPGIEQAADTRRFLESFNLVK